MPLPTYLQDYLDRHLADRKLTTLLEARENLTQGYKGSGQPASRISNSTQALAYLATRLPAIYAVAEQVLRRLKEQWPELQPVSLLDLGSGPGTVVHAAAQVFDSLQQVSLLERNPQLLQLARETLAESGRPVLKQARWQAADLQSWQPREQVGLVTMSYVLNELPDPLAVLDQAWKVAGQALILIEPGTPLGFAGLNAARNHLLKVGAHILAPCPHAETCPMTEQNWCHFSRRVERTKALRYLKAGSKSYEDEKYSYLIVTREPVGQLATSRILRHPMVLKGHIDFELCTRQGLQARTVSRSQPQYKQAKKAEWGDTLDLKI